MLLAQISDLHISRPGSPVDTLARTTARLAAAVEHLNRFNPRLLAVLVTGDLVDEGSEEEYERLVGALEPLKVPHYVIPGNHDHREHLRAAFADDGYLPASGFLQYVVDLGELRVVALDTHVPGEPGGLLCDERLAWLDDALGQAPMTPTIVMRHHPPFRTGLGQMDAMGLSGSRGLEAVLKRHPQVERVACGHLHRFISSRFAGTIAMTIPSTAHQLELDLRPGGRLAVLAEPPVVAIHAWSEDGGLVTHLSYVDEHGPATVIVDAEPADSRR